MNGKILMLILFTGTICMMLFLYFHGRPLLLTPVAKAGIVSLEFAKTKAKAEKIVSAWSSNGNRNLRKHAIINTYIDFIFIFFYSLFLFIACYSIAISLPVTWQPVSKLVSLFGLKAGLLDVLENYYLLRMLHFSFSEMEVQLTWWLALVKFSLAGIAMLFILLGLIRSFALKP